MKRLKRWGAALLMLLLAGLGAGGVAAAAGAPAVGMELLVLLPHGRTLAVYQQMVLTGAVDNPTVAVLNGHGPVTPIEGRLLGQGPNTVEVAGRQQDFALKYTVPWDGTSKLLSFAAHETIGNVVVMVPLSMNAPAVLNPSWQTLSPRTIPGLPHSPKFRVYATGGVQPGETVAIAVENGSGPVNAAPPQPVGYPRAAAVFTLVLALVVLAGVALAVNWVPLKREEPDAERREALLSRLASLEAARRQGELDDADFRALSAEVIEELERTWPARAG
jgi:hypothetical protein